MQGSQTPLHVRAGTHLLGRADQDAYAPRVNRIEQYFLLGVALRVVNEGDLARRNAHFRQSRPYLVVNVETIRMGRRQVAEHELR